MSEQDPATGRIEIDYGNGVILKQLVEADAQPYFDLIQYDPEHFRQFGDDTADKYKTVEDVLDSILNPDPSKPGRLRFGVWDGGTMVGSVNLTSKGGGTAELGYWTGKQYLGNGYAPRAAADLTKYGFEQLGLRSIFADVTVGNENSKRVLKKAGYSYAGTFDKKGEQVWRYELQRPLNLQQKNGSQTEL